MINRQPEGIPIGGQFAAAHHAEPGVSLSIAPRPRNTMPALGSAAAGYTDRLDEDGSLVLQVRMENGRPNDAADGTAAIIHYSTDPAGCTREVFYTDGILHDGSGDKPTERRTWPSGRTELVRGFRRPHHGHTVQQDSPDGQPASVKTSAEGHVITGYYADGRLQNPAPRTPARVEVRTDGTRIEQLAPFGELADLPDGTPSEHHYGPAGNLTAEIRRFGGYGWDSDYGDPSERRYRDNGTICKEVYRYQGVLLDSPVGKPALIEYAEDGSVTRQIAKPFQWDPYRHEEVRPNARVTRHQAWKYSRKEPVPRYVPAR
ncbi:hypothetical protein [Pseudarthrobacter sp. BIM B-2242]|uniref:hypothetical protein n=1 Tax=Pseudarthrobacter sp. BIM B-2242 TaxID=2772401 RepID=UPI00168A71A5|nr:hypothetical protein [Pseudarthrobacter sp. BIM B-2242]QOD05801.1 hypothetical protein IDT60_22670 [Pseudarthrobacter sp. BIM B-2242]